MEHDYYQVLDVHPNADAADIRNAYRRCAMQCHPDRGGSHEQMVLVNEAWEILSDPERRQRYDEVRLNTANLSVQAAAAADAQQAHQQAEQYPRRWEDFKKEWLDGVAKDFIKAEYKPMGGWHSFSSFPKAGKSVSGWLFILLGAVLGLVFLAFAFDFFRIGIAPEYIPAYKYDYSYYKYYLSRYGWLFRLLCSISIIGGAWLGAAVHQIISNAIGQSQVSQRAVGQQKRETPQAETQRPESRHSSASEIIVCGNCGQKLRVPIRSSRLLVKCQKCQHEFYHQTNQNHT